MNPTKEYVSRYKSKVAFESNQVKSAFNQKPTESPDIRYSLRQTDTDEFKQWFGKSQIKTLRGEPMRMYHGTARDISEFRPKQANAIFLTYDPRFAEGFADRSEDFMVTELFKTLSAYTCVAVLLFDEPGSAIPRKMYMSASDL